MSTELRAGALLIDRFRLIERLGQGGFASVWLAQDLRTAGRQVAVKVLTSARKEQRDARERFIAEARMLCAMDHPGIAKAYEVHASEDVALYAMEHVRGTTLKSELERRANESRPYSAEEALELGFALGAALEHAHARRVIHRDLKPANVLLPPDAPAKLVDFGIAKDLDRADATTQGRFYGSWAYMAPEQLRGVGVGASTDVFALASVLFEVLTLRRAWLRDERDEPQSVAVRARLDGVNGPIPITDRVARGPRPSVCKLRPELPAAIDSVLAAGLAIEPRDRPASATLLVEALAAALEPPRPTVPLAIPAAPHAAVAPFELAKTEAMGVQPYVAEEPRSLDVPVLPQSLSASDYPMDGDTPARPPVHADSPALGPGMRIAKQESSVIGSVDAWGRSSRSIAWAAFLPFGALGSMGAMLALGEGGLVARPVLFWTFGVLSLAIAARSGLEAYGHLRGRAIRAAVERWSDTTGFRMRALDEESGRGLVFDVSTPDGAQRSRVRLRLYPYWRRGVGRLSLRISTEVPDDAQRHFGNPGEWRAFQLESFVRGTISQLPTDAATRQALEDARSRLASSEVERVESDAYQVACEARIPHASAARVADELASVARAFLHVSELLWRRGR